MRPAPQPLPTALADPDAYRDAFAEGLERMLADHDGLGVFILVLANAAYEAPLWQRLRQPLAARFDELARRTAAALRAGQAIREPEDDLVVFLKLMAMGFDGVGLTELRQVGPWEAQFNPLRALRPPRASAQAVSDIAAPFDPRGFHFNKPFLKKEIFWEGGLRGRPAALLYNKFPFAPLHGLLVPEPALERPQWLTPRLHAWAWEVTATLGSGLPGLGLAYNSLGAQASVNHLHFQMFLRDVPLPADVPGWRHNGGVEIYPAACEAYEDPDEAWRRIDELHRARTAYNLVHRPGRLLLLPRRHQGSHPRAAWCAGFTWYEMAGGVTTFNRADFDGLSPEAIAGELAATVPV